MTIKRKTGITLFILAVTALLLIFFVINPIFNQIKIESENLVIQKNKIAESEVQIKNIQDFLANFKRYQPNLEKISQLFVNISEPIGFIEFLENNATSSRLSIEIDPPASKSKDEDFWPSLEFSLDLKGSLSDFSRFLEKLETSPYFTKIMDLNIRRIPNTEDVISAVSIKVYAK